MPRILPIYRRRVHVVCLQLNRLKPADSIAIGCFKRAGDKRPPGVKRPISDRRPLSDPGDSRPPADKRPPLNDARSPASARAAPRHGTWGTATSAEAPEPGVHDGGGADDAREIGASSCDGESAGSAGGESAVWGGSIGIAGDGTHHSFREGSTGAGKSPPPLPRAPPALASAPVRPPSTSATEPPRALAFESRASAQDSPPSASAPGSPPSSPAPAPPPALAFESRFESANLRYAVRVSHTEYDLVLSTDANTKGHTQWFYFGIAHSVPGRSYKFNFLNLVKPDSLFNRGLQARRNHQPVISQTSASHQPVISQSSASHQPVISQLAVLHPHTPNPVMSTNISPTSEHAHTLLMRPRSLPIAQPLVYSMRDAEAKGVGWRRKGTNVCYYQNGHRRKTRGGSGGAPHSGSSICGGGGGTSNSTSDGSSNSFYHTLSFELTFDHSDDIIFIAYCYPHTHTDLRLHLRRLESDPCRAALIRRRPLCETLGGNVAEVLTITALPATAEALASRKGVAISARVHPGESNASYMMEGILDFLTDPTSAEARALRDKFIFKLIPSLNPDGVVCGNYRCSLAGLDLNRMWKEPSKRLTPVVHYAKQMLARLREERELLLFADLHGHSRKHNVFCYGCSSRGGSATERRSERLFAKLLARRGGGFSFKDCSFRMQKGKESTARVVARRELEIVDALTLEASFAGADFGSAAGVHFSAEDLRRTGAAFCGALYDYTCGGSPAARAAVEEELRVLFPVERAGEVACEGEEGGESEGDEGGESEGSDEGVDEAEAAQLVDLREAERKLVRKKGGGRGQGAAQQGASSSTPRKAIRERGSSERGSSESREQAESRAHSTERAHHSEREAITASARRRRSLVAAHAFGSSCTGAPATARGAPQATAVATAASATLATATAGQHSKARTATAPRAPKASRERDVPVARHRAGAHSIGKKPNLDQLDQLGNLVEATVSGGTHRAESRPRAAIGQRPAAAGVAARRASTPVAHVTLGRGLLPCEAAQREEMSLMAPSREVTPPSTRQAGPTGASDSPLLIAPMPMSLRAQERVGGAPAPPLRRAKTSAALAECSADSVTPVTPRGDVLLREAARLLRSSIPGQPGQTFPILRRLDARSASRRD